MGVKCCSLGNRILRSETAPLYLMSVIGYSRSYKMIKLLKKYGVELKLKKCDLFRLIEGQKDTFLEDGFTFKMTNEEEMFKYEVILNGIYNKTKIEGEYKKFVYETQDAIQ